MTALVASAPPRGLTTHRIPLSWLQLVHEPRRLLAAIAGIAFAVVLMLMQLGFKDGLYASATLVHDHLRGELVLTSKQYEFLLATKSFTRRRLYQALALPQVGEIRPLYVRLGNWKNPETHRERALLVLGVEPARSALDLPGMETTQFERVRRADSLLFDRLSRAEFGPVPAMFSASGNAATELEGRRIHVEGLFDLGTSFASDGNVLTSDINFLRLFPTRRAGLIDIGLVALRPGTDVLRTKKELRALLPSDVRVLTREEFSAAERNYWETSSPIAFIFALGTAMGLIVGGVIVYQILYTDVSNHLPEYATLKAMGYAPGYFRGIVLQEALILSLLGYVPGFVISWALYAWAWRATQLPITMTIERALVVAVLTAAMCAFSGALAMRRLRAADPAEIFG